jgi:protein-S-isoprenylcysteine O-methyltransferase Ste14
MRFDLPLWMNIIGGVLFIIYSLWGLLVVFFNTNYTPLYRPPRGEYIIVTEGPYSLVRHPRYMAAALANLIYFLFTGFWISLLGILGWVAVYAQAHAEEKFLLTLAPQAYGEYYRKTGMFFPKIYQLGKSR